MGMHNYALRRAPDAYTATLADAYRIASRWANEEPDRRSHGIESYSAIVKNESACHQSKNSRKKRISFSWDEKRRKSQKIVVSDHLRALRQKLQLKKGLR
jgi:hypothetical protein